MRNPQAQRDLADPYQLHRTLARVFPGARADGDGANEARSPNHGLLFRSEPDAPGGPAVLVQSLTEPDWSALEAGYARRIDGPKPFDPALEVGQRLRFRLVANPTVKKKRPGQKNGARVPLVHDRVPAGHTRATLGYLDWLERKAEAAGLALEADRILDAPFEVRTRKAGGHRITLFGVRFDGTASVDNPDALADALRGGVGPAKGLGFGLLSLAMR
ncbi:type I-E CRISPR-associated protein Cas6/Cse3/CasE [Rubrivirga sp.]|uniref:type I-E CRISPR-associated protein Cas6/Cse3/CasE n=1 Tax=Rubrivirga sp. TaxID=1885344 RepID=UPI003C75F608